MRKNLEKQLKVKFMEKQYREAVYVRWFVEINVGASQSVWADTQLLDSLKWKESFNFIYPSISIYAAEPSVCIQNYIALSLFSARPATRPFNVSPLLGSSSTFAAFARMPPQQTQTRDVLGLNWDEKCLLRFHSVDEGKVGTCSITIL